jgi:two-component system sensor histidine kinase KdpD
VAEQRRRTQEARQREHEAVLLNEVVYLISHPELEEGLRAVAERLRDELHLSAIGVFALGTRGLPIGVAVAGDPEVARGLPPTPEADATVLQPGSGKRALHLGGPGRWVKVRPPRRNPTVPRKSVQPSWVHLTAGGSRVGTMALVRPREHYRFSANETRLLFSVASQLGLAIERARLRREATDAEVLRRADELKTALLNAVSHDLRTPLTAIVTSASSLRQKDVAWTAEERDGFARAIEQEALRLNRIVGNLLNLSRIEAGSLKPERGWYDLRTLIDEVLDRMRPTTANHRIVVSVPNDLPPVPVDYVEIDQVISNLVENAVKYTPAHTEISVAAYRTSSFVHVEVSDHGPGIPDAALPLLFTPFYRVETTSPERPHPGGTGLGLTVAKGLVEAHGGHIWAENRRGGGARFVFTLPLAMAEQRAPAALRREA